MELLKRLAANEGIFHEITHAPVSEDIFEEEFEESYTLKKRVSAEGIINEYIKRVKGTQQKYLEEIMNHEQFIKRNLLCALKMDKLFNDGNNGASFDEADGFDEIVKQKDGTLQVKCPLFGCPSKTFKLHRHFQSQHPEVEEKVIRYAIAISKHIEKNKNLGTTAVEAEIGAILGEKKNSQLRLFLAAHFTECNIVYIL